MYSNYCTKLSAVAFASLLAIAANAQNDSNAKSSNSKEEGDRNVMLNAASANGPREIQIGLPSADVNVLENGLPVTYATNPHTVNSTWRSDASLSHVGLLKISETAITTGNIGYAVNSHTQLGTDGFHGTLNYKTNHFGLQEVSLNMNGSLAKDLFYSVNAYQDFDPGTFKLRSTPLQDRAQIYKGALTKRYAGGRGEITALYKYSNSHPVYNYATQSAPFIYVGDGSVKEYGKFKLGTTSYLPTDNTMTYRDMRTGELKQTTLYDATENRSSEVSLLNRYRFSDNLEWRFNARYDHSRGACVYQTPMDLINLRAADAGTHAYKYTDAMGQTQDYKGQYVQTRMSCLNAGTIDELLLTSEIEKRFKSSILRVGLNEWYYNIDYASNTTMYDQSVPDDGSYALRLWDSAKRNNVYYDFNKNASEYYKGHENKLALYLTHDWDITQKLNVYYGARLEWQRLKGENAAVKNANGEFVGRFADYYLGATAPDGTKIATTPMAYNWLNYDFTAALIYLDLKKKHIVMDRSESGLTDFGRLAEHHDIEKQAAVAGEMKGREAQDLAVNYKNDFALGTWAPLSLCGANNNIGNNRWTEDAASTNAVASKTYHLDIFVDKCSIEVFVDGGRIAMTNLVFPTLPYNNMKMYAEGGKAEVKNLNLHKLGL